MSVFSTHQYQVFADLLKVPGENFPRHVVFRKRIFEEDFVEGGMRAYITGVEDGGVDGTVKLFFYFGDDFDHNKRLFRKSYYGKSNLRQDTRKKYTAVEVLEYQEYYSVYVMGTDLISDYLVDVP